MYEYGEKGSSYFAIIKMSVKTGILRIDTSYQGFNIRLSIIINDKNLNEIEKEKHFKEIIDDTKESLAKIKDDTLKECIDKRNKYLRFGKCYFALFYRMLANIQIKKLVKKIEEIEKYLENQEKELLKNSNEKASLVLEDKK